MYDIENKEFKEKFEAEIEKACSIDLNYSNFKVNIDGLMDDIIDIKGDESC